MASIYSASGFARGVVVATTVAGTLDILGAFVFDVIAKGTPLGVLRGIANAALPHLHIGTHGLPPMHFNNLQLAGVGLVIHFAIMFLMALVYFLAAAAHRIVNRLALLSGIGYGLILWGVMYWLVLPHFFPTMFPVDPRTDPKEVGMELFSHIVLVGIPIALVARKAAWWHRLEYY
jgi:uncharacterized membrane protein YagU involved in acid resistance